MAAPWNAELRRSGRRLRRGRPASDCSRIFHGGLYHPNRQRRGRCRTPETQTDRVSQPLAYFEGELLIMVTLDVTSWPLPMPPTRIKPRCVTSSPRKSISGSGVFSLIVSHLFVFRLK